MLCFQPCSVHYIALQTKNSTRSISAVNPVATENTDDKDNSQHSHKEVTLCINTLRCQRKVLEHKGGQKQVHDVCIVRTSVGKKARLG